MELKGRRITVVGVARSGVGAANLLCCLGAQVTVTDRRPAAELEQFLEMLSPGAKRELGHHPETLFTEADLVVVSPGVPLSIPPMKRAAERGIRIIGELEVAYDVATEKGSEFIAITGTNGKSTTTSLVAEMLKEAGLPVLVGGNIGNSLAEEIVEMGCGRSGLPAHIVAEVSSFQLETTDSFRPRVAAILNITPDHLDRYASMEEYVEAKCRIFLNQGAGDSLVLNADDPMTEEILRRVQGPGSGVREEKNEGSDALRLTPHASPEIFFFSREREVQGAWCRDGVMQFDLPGRAGFRMPAEEMQIKGVHNIENAMAAGIMALLAGCSPEAVERTLSLFPGLEHRLEFVRELEGVRYINDSKGTNVGAVMKSLEGFTSPVVLIAGGRDKHGDFEALRPFVKGKVKALVLIGEARELIAWELGELAPVYKEPDLLSAVQRAKDLASPGDTVLLSPACASFDMFRDFEDRGRQFKEIVKGL